MIKILEDDNWTVDYSPERDMYRVSYFEDGHFVDECWFCSWRESGIVDKTIPKPVIRFNNYNHEWWAGRCPNCNKIISFDYGLNSNPGNRKCYCSKCGQLCDFKDID